MELYTNESILISRLLDHLGYGKQMVTFRNNMYKRLEPAYSNLLTLSHKGPLKAVIVGSKGEGLTSPLEGDYDHMVVCSDVVCKEYLGSVTNREEITVFELDMKDAAPGYTYLRLINFSDNQPAADSLRNCLVEFSPDYIYLSSDFWKNEKKEALADYSISPGNLNLETVDRENHGTSTTVEYFGTVSYDFVCAFACDCPSYSRSWSNRERSNQWPSDGVIRDVSKSEPHVVPVGDIYSSMQYLEWRICFTKGEIILVQSLNDCLTKCLILLKQIAKITLKPMSKDISSYIVKNVIFWVAELNNYDFFKEDNLSLVLKLALLFLKHCVSRNNLPNYMIPERNLLSGRLTVNQRAKVCMRIDYLLKEGPMMVHRWKKVRHAFIMLYRSPEEFYSLSERRHRVQETFLLMVEHYVRNVCKPFDTIEDSMRALYNDSCCEFLMHKIAQLLFDEDNITVRITSEELEEVLTHFRVNGIGASRESLVIPAELL